MAEALATDTWARGRAPSAMLRLWAALEPDERARRALERLAQPRFRVFHRAARGHVTLWLVLPRAPEALEALTIDAPRGEGRVVVRHRSRITPEALHGLAERPLASSTAEAARLLWRFRRGGGRLPTEARRFASAFDAQGSWRS